MFKAVTALKLSWDTQTDTHTYTQTDTRTQPFIVKDPDIFLRLVLKFLPIYSIVSPPLMASRARARSVLPRARV